MSLARWFSANTADTRGPTHADLGPLTLPGPVPAAARAVREAAGRLRGWAVLPDSSDGEVRLTRTTRIMRFVDDVVVSLEGGGGGAVTVHARSQSRTGKGDLGQNRRNILELWRALTPAKG